MGSMTMPATAVPSRVATRTATAVKNLTTEQLHAILVASTTRSARVFPVLWDTVRAADPVLAETLDNLHAEKAPADLARFEALQQLHQENIAAATKTRAGRIIAAQAIGGGTLVLLSIFAAIVGMVSFGVAVSGVVIAAYLVFKAFKSGRNLADQLPTRLFADAELAASIVWDTAVDAAAAAALRHRAGEAGLTPDVLRALSLTWTNAGLPLDALVPITRAPRNTARAAKRPSNAPKLATTQLSSDMPMPAAA
jgi:hypothetical protein